MKISMICVEDALMNVGFRKMAARMKQLNPETTVSYVTYTNYRSLATIILGRYGAAPAVREDHIREMAEPIAHSDIVAFSSMTGYAPLTRDLIRHVREINPHAYILWGGIHPIIVPDDAIQHADAICTGEGSSPSRHSWMLLRMGRTSQKQIISGFASRTRPPGRNASLRILPAFDDK